MFVPDRRASKTEKGKIESTTNINIPNVSLRLNRFCARLINVDEKIELYRLFIIDIILSNLNVEKHRQMRMRMMREKAAEILEIDATIRNVPGTLNNSRNASPFPHLFCFFLTKIFSIK